MKAHRIFLYVLVLHVVFHGAWAAEDPMIEATRQADQRIQAFERASRSGDAAAMQKAALKLQTDPIAVRRLNQYGSDAMKSQHNKVTDTVKFKTRWEIIKTVAKEHKVKPAQVSLFEATNPNKTGAIKVGQDWDVTVRVNGKDVPHTVAKQHVNNAYYKSVHGKPPPTPKAANVFAAKQQIETVSSKHAEAYGLNKKEALKILNGPKNAKVADPGQLGRTIEYKSNEPGNHAAKLEAQGKHVEAQGPRTEQYRQHTKQYENQIKPRVEARGGKVPAKVAQGVHILKQVELQKMTPTEARAALAKMNETPESIISKSSSLIEAAQVLRPNAPQPGLLTRARIGLNEGVNSLQKSSMSKAGLSELSANAGMMRKGLNMAGKGLGAAGMVLTANELGNSIGVLTKGGAALGNPLTGTYDPNVTDGEAEAIISNMENAANSMATIGVVGTIGVAVPPLGAVIGGVQLGTTYGPAAMNSFETGRAIENMKVNAAVNASEGAWNAVATARQYMGFENKWEREQGALNQRQMSYINALKRGELKLKEGTSVTELMNHLKNNESKNYNSGLSNLVEEGPNHYTKQNQQTPATLKPTGPDAPGMKVPPAIRPTGPTGTGADPSATGTTSPPTNESINSLLTKMAHPSTPDDEKKALEKQVLAQIAELKRLQALAAKGSDNPPTGDDPDGHGNGPDQPQGPPGPDDPADPNTTDDPDNPPGKKVPPTLPGQDPQTGDDPGPGDDPDDPKWTQAVRHGQNPPTGGDPGDPDDPNAAMLNTLIQQLLKNTPNSTNTPSGTMLSPAARLALGTTSQGTVDLNALLKQTQGGMIMGSPVTATGKGGDFGLLQANRNLALSGTAGQQQVLAAQQLINQGGATAQGIMSQSAAQTASANAANSLGQTLGQAVETMVIEGGAVAAQSFSSQAAGHVTSSLFGNPGRQGTSSGHTSAGGAVGNTPAQAGGSDPNAASGGDPQQGGGKKPNPGAASSQGGDGHPPPNPQGGGTGHPPPAPPPVPGAGAGSHPAQPTSVIEEYTMLNCGNCKRATRVDKGQPFPAACPHCNWNGKGTPPNAQGGGIAADAAANALGL